MEFGKKGRKERGRKIEDSKERGKGKEIEGSKRLATRAGGLVRAKN